MVFWHLLLICGIMLSFLALGVSSWVWWHVSRGRKL
jgi:high-affinity Fe2+/Pb2+ permease